jgi:hypothetical protein
MPAIANATASKTAEPTRYWNDMTIDLSTTERIELIWFEEHSSLQVQF